MTCYCTAPGHHDCAFSKWARADSKRWWNDCGWEKTCLIFQKCQAPVQASPAFYPQGNMDMPECDICRLKASGRMDINTLVVCFFECDSCGPLIIKEAISRRCVIPKNWLNSVKKLQPGQVYQHASPNGQASPNPYVLNPSLDFRSSTYNRSHNLGATAFPFWKRNSP